jgi:cyclin-dependent kinase 8/11
LNREISHENMVAMKEVILEEKSIYMVFEYAEHDFLVRPSRFPKRFKWLT